MKTADTWMPIYVADLIADTLHLTLAEFGAYHMILYHQWRNGPIQERLLRSITRLSETEWDESRATLMAFLTQDTNGLWHQKRCTEEKVKADRMAARSRENGALGGRPRTQNKPRHNLEVIPDHNLDTPLDKTPSPSPSPSPAPTQTAKTASPAAHPFLDAWNSNCGSLPKVSKLTGARHKRLAVRIKAGLTVEDFAEAVKLAAATPFLCGDNDRGWKCGFDFLLKEDSLAKLIEGAYGEARATDSERALRDLKVEGTFVMAGPEELARLRREAREKGNRG